jgi:anti-anti-sigma regulatory factor/nucleotide-binding universal stress UspA family protein
MIVTGKNDVVHLSGALHKNQWLTIKAAAKLLLQQHPQGILIDCSELTEVSEEGTKTFLEAMRDIQGEGARIVIVNLPDSVLQVIRSVPGVRSQLPIAKSEEEARASLRVGVTFGKSAERPLSENSILIPLLPGFDIEYAIIVAGRASRELRQPITLAALIVVSRNKPLNTPMPEEEAEAVALLEKAEAVAKRHNLPYARHVERLRDAEEGLLQVIKTYKASHVYIGAYADHSSDEQFLRLVEILLHRAPCSVIIARQAPSEDHPLE